MQPVKEQFKKEKLKSPTSNKKECRRKVGSGVEKFELKSESGVQSKADDPGESRRSLGLKVIFEQKRTILWVEADYPSFYFKQTIVLQ